MTVKERATECKFPADFYEQAVRDKLTFPCKEDTNKLKLSDEGAALSLEKAVKTRELQVSKPADIECHTAGTGQILSLIKIQSKGTSMTLRGSPSKRVAGTVAIATADMPLERGTAQLRIHDAAIKVYISLSSARVYLLKVLETEDAFSLTFEGGVTAPTCSNTSMVGPTLDGMSSSKSKTKTC